MKLKGVLDFSLGNFLCLRGFARMGDLYSLSEPDPSFQKIGTDTIIVTIRDARGHDRVCHGLPESLHPATRIMCGNEGMIVRQSFGTTAIRRHAMTERPLQRDGFIWEVRRKLDE